MLTIAKKITRYLAMQLVNFQQYTSLLVTIGIRLTPGIMFCHPKKVASFV
jgi:hypothetical protein